MMRVMVQKIRYDLNGFLVLDKPAGMSSNQALGRVKRMFHPKKAGYMGTLDPLATGVLPIAFGKATKLIEPLMHGKKAYDFRISWGYFTTTGDAEGEEVRSEKEEGRSERLIPIEKDILKVIPSFIGEISQIPPVYSAIKIDGRRACDLARQGKAVDLAPRVVMIFDLKLISCDEKGADFSCICSKGTYIRALSEDIAKALQTAGFTENLRRTLVEPFSLSKAYTIEALAKATENGVSSELQSLLTPLCDIKAGP